MWPFRQRQKPLLIMDMKAQHDSLFGEGSWDELESKCKARLKKNNPFLCALITEIEDH